MQVPAAFDLIANVRRGVEQVPGMAIDAHGQRILSAGGRDDRSASEPATARARAVPLRKTAPGCGAEDLDSHCFRPLPGSEPAAGSLRSAEIGILPSSGASPLKSS